MAASSYSVAIDEAVSQVEWLPAFVHNRYLFNQPAERPYCAWYCKAKDVHRQVAESMPHLRNKLVAYATGSTCVRLCQQLPKQLRSCLRGPHSKTPECDKLSRKTESVVQIGQFEEKLRKHR